MIELLQNLLKIKSISPNDMGCFDLIENSGPGPFPRTKYA